MDADKRHQVYELTLQDEGRFKISSQGFSMEAEYVDGDGQKPTLMSPAQFFFSSFMA